MSSGLTPVTGGRLEAVIGYTFRDTGLLKRALTHRSFGQPHNERLEFLGDSVLNFLVANLLYDRFADLREGDLSRLRANLVRQDALHEIAETIGLGESLLLGEGEMKSGGFRRPSILADALEAVLGAVLLDGGVEAARALVFRLYEAPLAALDARAPAKDPKTALQEWLQARRHGLPRYELHATRGESHAQEFEVTCSIDALGVATKGLGVSRRAAEQEAARFALQALCP